jgi:hypothetical protein
MIRPFIAGSKNVIIETFIFLGLVVAAGVIVVKLYEWRQDVLYGPYIGPRSGKKQ